MNKIDDRKLNFIQNNKYYQNIKLRHKIIKNTFFTSFKSCVLYQQFRIDRVRSNEFAPTLSK
ncbi:hypothetical protein CKA32_006104 [Geitlerinema sp. FC II]|nr:hypothetical protein CKA32_006104 [Geitlerinema sp. FC II]